MARPPVKSADEKLQAVLTVLKGEASIKETARRVGVSETTITNWRNRFLEGGRTALAVGGRAGPDAHVERLEAEVDDLKVALGEATAELRAWRKGGPSGRPTGARADPTRGRGRDLGQALV